MKRCRKLKGLLIDIDDTIVQYMAPEGRTKKGTSNTGSLMQVLQAAGEELGGLSAREAARRITRIQTELRWWHWSDFIVELGLNPKRFWEFAYRRERRYIKASGPEILPALQRLQRAGLLLYVTSNNPSSGILHKLRLAGVAQVTGTTLFSQLLGGTELHAMKWEPIYWKKVLAHTALDGDEVAVVGDNLHDDYEVPLAAGISRSFIIDRSRDRSDENVGGLTFVRSFDEVVRAVLAPTKAARTARTITRS